MAALSNKEIYLELILSNAKDLVDLSKVDDLVIAHCKRKSCHQLKDILALVEQIRTALLKLREKIQQQ